MLDTLFEGYAFKILFGFIVVFGVLALALWLVRRFGGDRLASAGGRGRQPRLAVIDAANVDGRRKLVLVRRDNVEHLLMIGGPSDVVIEPNIVRAATAPREAAPQRPVPTADTLPRALPLSEGSLWPLQPEPAAKAEPPPRTEPPLLRPSAPPPPAEPSAHWPPPREPGAPVPPPITPRDRRPRHDALSGLAEELGQAEPPAEAPEPVRQPARRESRLRPVSPPPRPAVGPAGAPGASPASDGKSGDQNPGDENLANMAQRLEAALRRPNRQEEAPLPPSTPRPQDAESTQADNGEARVAQASSPAPRASPPAHLLKASAEEIRPGRSDAKPAPQQKSLYDSLEQEMASLLGRPAKG